MARPMILANNGDLKNNRHGVEQQRVSVPIEETERRMFERWKTTLMPVVCEASSFVPEIGTADTSGEGKADE